MKTTLKINHLAILACVLLSFGIGFAWYGPLFGQQWMAMVELDEAAIEANPPGAGIWITNILSSVVPLYLLAWLFVKLDVRNGIRGAGLALLFSFSFNFLSGMTSDMFAQAPYGLVWITDGFNMAFLTISGFILGAWIKTAPAE